MQSQMTLSLYYRFFELENCHGCLDRQNKQQVAFCFAVYYEESDFFLTSKHEIVYALLLPLEKKTCLKNTRLVAL